LAIVSRPTIRQLNQCEEYAVEVSSIACSWCDIARRRVDRFSEVNLPVASVYLYILVTVIHSSQSLVWLADANVVFCKSIYKTRSSDKGVLEIRVTNSRCRYVMLYLSSSLQLYMIIYFTRQK